jgi:hypothetical protein
MAAGGANQHLVVGEDPRVYRRLAQLEVGSRMVFFAGLPGTGKSLLIHQLAHLADASGRTIHLLQWDVVRPRFESSEAGTRYPILNGVTHIVIRRAVGVWARHALARWHEEHPDPKHLLIGETPLVGHRLIELARPMGDAAEPLLTSASCQFVIPVPSRDVRRFLEDERHRRILRPAHDREREDAPPVVLRILWEQLVDVARLLGLETTRANTPPPYDPDLYARVYRTVLTHRHAQDLPVETRFRSAAFSVYDLGLPTHELMPIAHEPDRFIIEVERQYPDLNTLEEEVARWYDVR